MPYADLVVRRVRGRERMQRWRARNPDRARAVTRRSMRRWRKRNPDWWARSGKEYSRLYKQKNRLRIKLRMRMYHEKNREYFRDLNKLTTARTKAIAQSLVSLFPLLPDDGWRRHFATEILESSSAQTLCWCCPALEELIVEYTEAE